MIIDITLSILGIIGLALAVLIVAAGLIIGALSLMVWIDRKLREW